MSWLTSFFRRDSTIAILKAIRKVLSLLVGRLGEDLHKAALVEVHKAELTGKSGIDKYEMAFKALREKADFKKISENAINIAIELAVAQISPKPNN